MNERILLLAREAAGGLLSYDALYEYDVEKARKILSELEYQMFEVEENT